MERAEKIGIGVATAGHVLLFGLLSTGFLSATRPLKLNSPPMDISMVDEVALRSAAPQISTTPPPPSEAPEQGPVEDAAPSQPAPPQPRAAPPPPEPEPAPAPPPPRPRPATRPVERAKPVPPAPPKAAPVKAKPRPEPAKPTPAKAASAKAPAKPAPPRERLKLALDRPDASGQGKATQPRGSRLGANFLKGIDSSTPAKATSPAPAAATVGPAQKAALDAEIRRQIKPYWKSPTGADVELLRTVVQVELNRDGSIADGPDVVDTTGITGGNRTQVKLHQELAVKAIRLAAPFRLPPDLYDGWKSLRISFDKRLSQ